MNMLGATAASRLIARTDHLRWSSIRRSSDKHKEWWHYSISRPDVDVLVNMSLLENSDRSPQARITLLVRNGAGWRGEVRTVPWDRVECHTGEIAIRMADCTTHFEDGAYYVGARTSDGSIDVDFRADVATTPSLIHNVDLGSGPPLHWLMVPRLVVRGRVCVEGTRISLDGSLAYHDHNWGRFHWGGDFAWQWGYAAPPSPSIPWTLVFVRMYDRALHRVRSQGIFVWRAARQTRVFRDSAVEYQRSGLLRAGSVCKFPPIMGLLYPGTATDVPAALTISARRDADEVVIHFEPEDIAQILVPADAPRGATLIQEVSGTLHCSGRIDDERWEFTNRTVMEFLRG